MREKSALKFYLTDNRGSDINFRPESALYPISPDTFTIDIPDVVLFIERDSSGIIKNNIF